MANRDADIGRLVAKYGSNTIGKSYKHWDKMDTNVTNPPKKIKKKNSKVIPQKDRKSWLEIHREYLRWRKTDDFQKWYKRKIVKQGGTCYYCDEMLIGTKVNVDHVIPKYHGGDNRKQNLVLACHKCNKEKYSNLLPKKTKDQLRVKNFAKRGTYRKNVDRLFANYTPTRYVMSGLDFIYGERDQVDTKKALEDMRKFKEHERKNSGKVNIVSLDKLN